MTALRWVYTICLIILLTVLTQVGGLLYLFHLPLNRYIRRRSNSPWVRRLLPTGTFLLLLISSSLLVVPPLAASFGGRVPLPLVPTASIPLAPARYFTVLANRHYVRPELREAMLDLGGLTAERYPGTRLQYLDANFPFFDGFPLLPHRSHDDGRKLDLAYLYTTDGNRLQRAPGFLGYGHVTAPLPGEPDQPTRCADSGYWQYSLLRYLSWGNGEVELDEEATGWLIRRMAADGRVRKIFLEPHVKQRLGLERQNKVRYHGCAAVRHDDHIHVQL